MSKNSERRVLIVEDDEDQLELLKRHLEHDKFLVEQASDGEEIISKINSFSPHILLLDVNLPGKSGLDILEEINTSMVDSYFATLLMSASIDKQTRIEGFMHGAYDFLQKPVDFLELSLKLRNIIRMRMIDEKLRFLNEKLEREKKLLTKYFSYDLVEQILNEEVSTDLGGKNVEASILFFDVRNSTGMAEKMLPENFSHLLSEIIAGVMKQIFHNYGSVNKLLGDGVLATFGAPLTHPDDAAFSVKCALEIQHFMKEFNEQKSQELGMEINYGIGISTGIVFAGNIGSSQRIEYTVLGDAVNLASRLQALTKQLNHNLVVEMKTARKAAKRYSFSEIGIHSVAGRETPVEVFGVSGARDEDGHLWFTR